MLTRKPMKRTGFKQPERPAKVARLLQPIRQDVSFEPAKLPVETPKARIVRSEDYRRLVASLPCYRCGIEGFSQAAHGDADKGMGMKSSDLTCYPLCGTRPGIPGCHYDVGTAGAMTKLQRRQFEECAAFDTFHHLKRLAYENSHIALVFVKMEIPI